MKWKVSISNSDARQHCSLWLPGEEFLVDFSVKEATIVSRQTCQCQNRPVTGLNRLVDLETSSLGLPGLVLR